jgi:hypothetical protein
LLIGLNLTFSMSDQSPDHTADIQQARQLCQRRRLYLVGVAKHSKVLTRYRLAMQLEQILMTDYMVFTNRQAPSPFYRSFVAGGIKLDIRRLKPIDVVSITVSPDHQNQQNVRA